MCIQLEITGRYRYIENLEGINKLIIGIEDFIEMNLSIYFTGNIIYETVE